MRKAIFWIALFTIAGGIAWAAYRRFEDVKKPGTVAASQPQILYYQDPMHPAYKSNKPGKAPDCGMDLIPIYADQETAPPKKPGERKILYYQDAMNPAHKSDKPGKAPDGMDLVAVYGDDSAMDSGGSLPPGTIRINYDKQQLIGVQYGQVERRHLTHTIRAVGKLAFDDTRVARIHSKIDGWIEQVMADFTGKEVQKGEPLLTIYSPELLATQQEFLLAARARRQLAGNPFAEVSSGAERLYQAARKRLELFDIGDDKIREIESANEPTKAVTLYAPLSGFVTARNAFPRQRITADTELYSIVDLSTIWVLADVYEYEIPDIHLGQPATMTLSYFPDTKYRGKVTYLYPQLDPLTRTMKVRLEFPNPGYRLHPEMFANLEFASDLGTQLAVPQEAVLDSGAGRTVFVDRGEGRLEPRKVELGEKVDGWYIVRKGLRAGERVVTSGNFLVDSESQLKAAATAMGGGSDSMPGMKMDAPPKSPSAPAGGPRHD